MDGWGFCLFLVFWGDAFSMTGVGRWEWRNNRGGGVLIWWGWGNGWERWWGVGGWGGVACNVLTKYPEAHCSFCSVFSVCFGRRFGRFFLMGYGMVGFVDFSGGRCKYS